MLIIRETQMEAMARVRRATALAELARRLQADWPKTVARSGQDPARLVDAAMAWATERRMLDSTFILLSAAVFAAFGAPPWQGGWVAPLHDPHLSASAAHGEFMERAHAEISRREAS